VVRHVVQAAPKVLNDLRFIGRGRCRCRRSGACSMSVTLVMSTAWCAVMARPGFGDNVRVRQLALVAEFP